MSGQNPEDESDLTAEGGRGMTPLDRRGLLAVAAAAGWPRVMLGSMEIAGEAGWRQLVTTPGERAQLVEPLRQALAERISADRRAFWADRARVLGLADPVHDHVQVRLLVQLAVVAADPAVRPALAVFIARCPAPVRALAVETCVFVVVGGDKSAGFCQRVDPSPNSSSAFCHRVDAASPDSPALTPRYREDWIIALDAAVLGDPERFGALVAHELGHAWDRNTSAEVVAESLAWSWGFAATPERYLVVDRFMEV